MRPQKTSDRPWFISERCLRIYSAHRPKSTTNDNDNSFPKGAVHEYTTGTAVDDRRPCTIRCRAWIARRLDDARIESRHRQSAWLDDDHGACTAVCGEG